MSKEKGGKPLKRYFILGVVILFLGLLYLFLSGYFNSILSKYNLLATAPTVSTNLDKLPENTNNADKLITQDNNSSLDSAVPSLKLGNKLVDDSGKTSPYVEPDKLNSGNKEAGRESDTSESEAVSTQNKSNQPLQKNSSTSKYQLPNGVEVKISAKGFANIFKQALENNIVGKPIIFDRVYFASGSEKLDKQSNQQISETAALLNAHKEIKIAIRGHSDNRGSSKNNSILSLLRGGSMKKALVNLGIDSRRIQIEGIGDQEPIASNKTKRGRRHNRRIDLIIRK